MKNENKITDKRTQEKNIDDNMCDKCGGEVTGSKNTCFVCMELENNRRLRLHRGGEIK
jgi:hypothetical protein